MFGRTPQDNDSQLLEPAMTRILNEMEMYGPEAPEYPHLLEQLQKVMELRASKDKRRFTPDTLLLVGGNILGILIIVGYEHAHVVVTKAKDYVLKPR